MNREQKEAAVGVLAKQLGDASAVIAVDYRGISVAQAAQLRAELREAGTRFKVVKNRLTLRAADQAGTEQLKDHLIGPTALALVEGDIALAAKTLAKRGAEWELLTYKGGLMDGDPLDDDSFQAIAKLPGRDQLNAQFLGIVASPITGLVRGLGSMVQGLAIALQQIADQGLVSGEAPPAEEPADAAAAEDAPLDQAPVDDTPADDAPADAAVEDDTPAPETSQDDEDPENSGDDKEDG